MNTDSRASSILPLFLSILACMLAGVALVVALSSRPEQAGSQQANADKNKLPASPPAGAIEKEKPNAPVPVSALPGKPIQDYDLSTPQSAIRSQMEIDAMADIRASLEYQRMQKLLDKDVALRSLSTLQFDRTIEHDGKVLVLYHYEDGGIPRQKTAWVQKREGRYFHTWVSTYEWAQDKGDKGRIYKLISEWEAKGSIPAAAPQPSTLPSDNAKSGLPELRAKAIATMTKAYADANSLWETAGLASIEANALWQEGLALAKDGPRSSTASQAKGAQGREKLGKAAELYTQAATQLAFAAVSALEVGEPGWAQEAYYNAAESCQKARDRDLAFKYAVRAGTLEGYLTEKARALAESLWEIQPYYAPVAPREFWTKDEYMQDYSLRLGLPAKGTPKPTRGDLPWKQPK